MGRTIDLVSLLASGPVGYDDAWTLQKEAEARVKAGGRETLFLLEHREVITLGRNASPGELHTSEERLQRLGIEVRVSDRGGKLTYHGPGQLVAYPILDLSEGEADVKSYVRRLEEALILTAADFGVQAARSPLPGRWSSVWVGNDKLAAIGVHISRWVTTHGVGLNVTTDLSRFSLFTPCGITDGGVTSLARLGGGSPPPSLAAVGERLVTHFSRLFARDPVSGGVR